MANLASPLTTYSDTTAQARWITDVISLIDPSDAPLVEALGGLDGASGKFRFVNGNSTLIEWLEDTLSPLSGALAHSATIASGDTSLTVDDGNAIQVGHVLLVDSEYLWVSAVSGTTITVTRNFGGTQATHTSTAAYEIVGLARLEGATSSSIGYTDRTSNSNYTQIFHKEIKATETMAVIHQYGIGDEFDYQANKAIPELMRLVEKQLFNLGTPKAGSATAPRTYGGLSNFISNNSTTGASLTKAMFDTAVALAYADGGVGPWIAPLSATNFGKVTGFYENSIYLGSNIDQGTSVVGMPPVTMIRTPYGDVRPLLDRWAKNGTIFLIDPKHAGYKTLRPFKQDPLAKTGDFQLGEVVGEFTFCCRQNNAHAVLTSVS